MPRLRSPRRWTPPHRRSGSSLLIALRTIRDRAPAERAEWAQRMLTDEVEPKLKVIIDAALELARGQEGERAT